MNKDLVVFNEKEFPQLYDMTFNDRVQLYSEVEAKSFYLRGKILESIREDQSYKKAGYKTFEKAVKDILDISKSFAYVILEATSTLELLSSNCGQNLPTAESQIRPLTKLLPEQQVEVWQVASKDGVPTAKQVKECMNELYPKPVKAPKKKEDVPIVVDIPVVDKPIVENITTSCSDCFALEVEISTLKQQVKDLEKRNDFLDAENIKLADMLMGKDPEVLEIPNVGKLPRSAAFDYIKANGNYIQATAISKDNLTNARMFQILQGVISYKLTKVPHSGIPKEILNAKEVV